MGAGSEKGDDDAGSRDELSLDPRTWASKPSQRPLEPKERSAPVNSYDPSTWAKPAQPPETPEIVDETPSSSARLAHTRRGLLIGAGAAGLLIVGGGGLLLSRRPKVASQPVGRASAGAVTEKQVVTLPNLAAVTGALTAYGVSAEDAGRITAAAGSVLTPQAASAELRLELDVARAGDKIALTSLALTRPDGSGARVTPAANGFSALALAATTRKQVKVARGQMDSESFYSSAVSAGLYDALIPDFFQAFVYDFDFQREIEPGDVFEAAFEETVNERGEPVGGKRLIYASMTTDQKSRALYSFTAAGEKMASWFDGAGRNVRRSLMKTPVEGARISSTFGPRSHPVLGYTRMHKGTDFATPIGTPVFASGDGKVSFLGVHGGHGNYIAVEHSPTLTTAYAHLSQYGSGLTVGSPVRQGQQIALTGNTGLSSGPHLHYEIIVNGQQVDSQTFQTEEGRTLTGQDLALFAKERDRIDAARTSSL